MGKYQDIVQIIEGSVPEYTNLNVVPRGTPIFSDILLPGEIKYAIRLGANFAVLNVDNQFQLTANANIGDTSLSVNRTLAWLEAGALLTFNSTEMLVLEDWDPNNDVIVLTEPLTQMTASGNNMILWATPMVVHANASVGATQVVVRSRYHILNGDAVTFPLSTNINSLYELNVTISDFAGPSGDPNYPYLFVLTLASPIPLNLTATVSPIYLRAFPGYLSNVLQVPPIAQGYISPFLVDLVATPMDSITSYPEYISLRTMDGSGNPIDGSTTVLKPIERNYPVVNRPIRAENMIFWDLIRGYGGFKNPNKFLLTTDSYGKGRVATRLTPSFPSGLSWQFKVTTTSDGVLTVISDPYPPQVFTLTANTTQTITMSTPAGGEVTKIDITAKMANAGSTLQFSDMGILAPVVSTFQYGMVFRVIGNANFQSTGIIVKPYFLSLSDLTSNYDTQQTYNSGLIYQ